MKVCIAEKPSVAREIAQVIGAKSRKDGYFEGNGYQVTWTFGHFCTLLPPEDYRPEWKRWDLNTLPMLPIRFETKVMPDKGVKKQYKVIKTLFKKAKMIINCGDAGQEGELIQRWVLNQTGYKGNVMRLWISSLTKEAIKEGFKQLRPSAEFDNLYYAGSSRAIGDWLLGMNATRLYTLKYGGYKQVISIGRVQTPTLAMLVKRDHEIKNFVAQAYWELQTVYRDTIFKYSKGKLNKKEDGEHLIHEIQNQKLSITKIEQKAGKEYAPKLFDLTSLQIYCNNKYGFSADNTLKITQKLYEMKLVSYPRVDTNFLPNDMYPKVPGILKSLKAYESYVQPIVDKKIRKSTKVFNDKKVTDHHAIIPTGLEKALAPNEQKVYDIITRRFIAVFYPDCEISKTQVHAQVSNIGFVARGKEVIHEGWKVLFPKSKTRNKDEDEGEKILPHFTKGEEGVHKPALLQKETKPPKLYSEATLLRAMETAGKQIDDEELQDLMKANGIGRPSTRANIIETLFRRRYARRQKKSIIPTDMGIQLIDTIQNKLLKSAELTGQWEKQLKEIEDGAYNPAKFIHDMKQMVEQLVTEVRMESSTQKFKANNPPRRTKYPKPNNTTTKVHKTKSPSNKNIDHIPCPNCNQGNLIKGNTSYGCNQWQSGCTFRIPFIYKGKKISLTQTKRIATKGSSTLLKGFVIDGQQKQDGKIILRSDGKLELQTSTKTTPPTKTNAKATMQCPLCKNGVIIKGKSAYGCSDWKRGCDFRYSFVEIKKRAQGATLTPERVMKLLSDRD